MILAVTHAGDGHAAPLLAALRHRGARAAVIDLADLPRRGQLALSYGGGGSEARTLRVDGQEALDARQVTALWWRRPLPLRAATGLSSADAAHAVAQTGEAVMGLLASLEPGALLVNQPWRDEAAGHKPNQLARAGRHGLRVPATLITSDPAAASAFLAEQGEGRAVAKLLRPNQTHWTTRRVGLQDLARLDDLRLAPVIFQEWVPGVDVRVTAVGEALFAAEIDPRSTRSPHDFREVYDDCKVAPCTLPPAVAAGLRGLLRELGLLYAAVDLRRRDDGAWFFLEVNPSGQWLFVEERTGLPITDTLAGLLATAPG
ncbi:MAG: alpha-L-glutamate ligase [Anaeromyxobacter sp.]